MEIYKTIQYLENLPMMIDIAIEIARASACSDNGHDQQQYNGKVHFIFGAWWISIFQINFYGFILMWLEFLNIV